MFFNYQAINSPPVARAFGYLMKSSSSTVCELIHNMLSTSSLFKFRYYHLPVCWSSPSPPSSAIPLSSLPLCWSSSISFTCVLELIGSTLLLSIPSKFHLSWYKNGKKPSPPLPKKMIGKIYMCVGVHPYHSNRLPLSMPSSNRSAFPGTKQTRNPKKMKILYYNTLKI